MIRRTTAAFAVCILLLSMLCGCISGADAPAAGVTVTDCAGREVTVPSEPVSICTLCPFSGQMAVLLGCGEKVTSTCNNVSRSYLLREICPSIADVDVVKSGGAMNAEEIMQLKTDLIFVDRAMYDNDDEKIKLETMGVPYVVIGFTTIDEQLKAVRILGQALGNEAEAETYIDWFRSVLDLMRKAPTDDTPLRLYHAVNEAVRTDSADSYCAEWISCTGAFNVSTDGAALRLEGDKAYTTLEQIYAWDPDLIICNEPQVDDYILSDPKWEGLHAVTEGRVYQIPVGVTRWGHPNSVETPLAMLWLAQLLHPEAFGYSMRDEIRSFYQKFYDFTLDDAWLTAIEQGDEMRAPRAKESGEAA